jgi:orotate phosphoribosyltransferase
MGIIDIYNRNELKYIIIDNYIVRRNKPIELSSGQESNYYFDIKKCMGDPKAAYLISSLLYHHILNELNDIRSVGGLETGSISISTAVAQRSIEFIDDRMIQDRRIYSFYVRKDEKQHGLRKQVEGQVKKKFALLEDVITTGKSLRYALDVLRDVDNRDIIDVICVIFRGTKEDLERIQKENTIKIHFIFMESDLIS